MATELLSLFAKIGIDDKEYNKGIDGAEKKAGGFGKALKAGFAVAGAGIAAATGAVVKIGKAAIESYANYEQLVGGVETLFKDSAPLVQQYADNAYKTAGLSANEYMETVTSFSASLLQSVGGDTEKAAKYADQAITDMSDNANKMGTSMESIQNAYQGFAKQNYTMLDNLKLGYGGTKEEMQRLLDDASKLSGQKFDISSYADVTQAIHVIQEEMGITGTTAKEASSTISGSLGMLKSSWQNVLTGVADDNQDFNKLLDNLVDSVVTFGKNIIPRIEIAFSGVGKLVKGLGQKVLPLLIKELPKALNSLLPAVVYTVKSLFTSIANVIPQLIPVLLIALPKFAKAGVDIVKSIIQGITKSVDPLVNAITDVANELTKMLSDPSVLKKLVDGAVKLLIKLANAVVKILPAALTLIVTAFTSSIDVLIPAIVEVITQLATILTNPDMLTSIVEAALQLIIALADGLINAIPTLIEALPEIIENIVTFFINSQQMIADAAVTLFMGLVSAIPKIATALLSAIGTLLSDLFTPIGEFFSGIWEQITTFFANVWAKIVEFFQPLIDFVSPIFTALHDLFSSVFGAIKDIVTGIMKKIKDAISGPIEKARDTVKAGLLKIHDHFKDILAKIITTVGKPIKAIKDKLAEPIDNFKKKVEEIKSKTSTWGYDMLINFRDGIVNGIKNVKDSLLGLLDWIKEHFHFSVPDVGPLSDANKWMPDFMDLLADGINDNKFKVVGAMDDLAGQMALGGDVDEYVNTTEESVQRFEFTFAEGTTPLKQIARLLFPYMQVVAKEKGVTNFA